jgi:hypothetical protein
MSHRLFFIMISGMILVLISYQAIAIDVFPNVQFSFGCTQPLPSNCSGNWYFKNELNFTNVKLYQNASYFNDIGICLLPPFFKNVFDYPDIFNYFCNCTSNWVYTPSSCYTNDTLVKHYTDTNACYQPTNIPIDEGQVTTCNYCSSDIIPIYGLCQEDSTQQVTHVDLNKPSCCDVTGLLTDCGINHPPYNETSFQGCNATVANVGNFSCNPTPEMGNKDRQPCQANIPIQYANEPYKCNSYVTDKVTGEVVQVNPDSSAHTLDSRDYFTPVHTKVDFYYTGKNLKPDKEYVVKLECASPTNVIYSEQPIERRYESMEWVTGRLLWVKNNVSNIIGGVLISILIFGVLFFIIRGNNR